MGNHESRKTRDGHLKEVLIGLWSIRRRNRLAPVIWDPCRKRHQIKFLFSFSRLKCSTAELWGKIARHRDNHTSQVSISN